MRPRPSQRQLRDAVAGLVIVLIAVPVGGAIVLALIHGDTPCILCWAQRTSMILIALVGLFVVRYGPRPRYLGLAVLLGAWGVFMSLRHSGLHLARDVGQGFAAPILGVHTYAWAWLVHWIVLLAIGVLFFFLREGDEEGWPRQPGGAFRFAVGLFVVVVAANAVQAFVTTGPPPFIGQGDPVRFALNPRHWVWSLEELSGSISLRGSWTVPPPDVAAVDPEPDHGPLADLPELDASAWERIDLPDGSLTGLAHDPVSGDFLAVTDRYDVYLLDETLARLVHGVTLDPSFSIDLSPLAGAAFLGDTLAVVSTNKSYALLRANGPVDEKREWRRFRVMDPEVSELSLGRFATVRARQMFVMSLAYDAAAEELITVAVPSPRHERLVVSRFARGDLILASEFEPRLAPGLTLSGEDRSLAEYVVSGAVAADGLLYALSAAYSTLLMIDLGSRTLVAAYAVPGLEQPTGLAARGSQLLVAQADGRVAVLERPALRQAGVD